MAKEKEDAVVVSDEAPATETTATETELVASPRTERIVLTGAEIDEITFVDDDNEYKSGKRKEKGKKYNRYSYIVDDQQVLFTVDSNNPFNADFENGTLVSVTLLKGERVVKLTDPDTGDQVQILRPSIQFHTSVNDTKLNSRFAREERQAIHTTKMSMIEKAGKVDLTDDSLATLLNAVPAITE